MSAQEAQEDSAKVAQKRTTCHSGIVSLVLGSVAFLRCFVPFFGELSSRMETAVVMIAGLGFVFGLAGILLSAITKRYHIWLPVVGTVVSAIPILVVIMRVVIH